MLKEDTENKIDNAENEARYYAEDDALRVLGELPHPQWGGEDTLQRIEIRDDLEDR